MNIGVFKTAINHIFKKLTATTLVIEKPNNKDKKQIFVLSGIYNKLFIG